MRVLYTVHTHAFDLLNEGCTFIVECHDKRGPALLVNCCGQRVENWKVKKNREVNWNGKNARIGAGLTAAGCWASVRRGGVLPAGRHSQFSILSQSFGRSQSAREKNKVCILQL